MSRLNGVGMGMAVVENVGKGFILTTAAPAPLVSWGFAWGRPSDCAVQRYDVEPRSMDEPPVGEPREVARPHHVVARARTGRDLINFSLVRLST